MEAGESDYPPKPHSKLDALMDKQVSRRTVLAVGSAAVAEAAVVGAKSLHPVKSITRRLLGKAAEGREIDSQIVSWVEIEHEPWPEGVKVGINKEGLPVKGIMPDGSEFKVDTNEARKKRELAKSNKIPELVMVQPFPAGKTSKWKQDVIDRKTGEEKFQPTAEHPTVEKMPDDVLTDEELKERGVTIMQTGEVQLSIRQSAFEEGGPLHTLQDSDRKLKIVLVDGPVVVEEFLEGKKYDKVRHILADRQEEIDQYRRKKVAEATKKYEEYRAGYHKKFESALEDVPIMVDIDDKKRVSEKIVRLQAECENWMKYITDGEMYMQMLDQGQGAEKEAAGVYHSGLFKYSVISKIRGKKDPTIFTAVGDSEFSSNFSYLYFDHNGDFKIIGDYADSRGGDQQDPKYFEPRPSQTHPDPEKFTRNKDASSSDPDSYPYAGQTPGFVLRHEAAHDELMRGSGKLNDSEYDTDERSMQGIRDAWKKWVDSGYKDDSGYCFAFKTDKGIILT